MSTRCIIGIKFFDGQIKTIYCHNNGEPESVGNLLINHYNTSSALTRLITLGDISSLGMYLEPQCEYKPHTFDNPQADTTVAYHRDRGETYYHNAAKLYLSQTEYESAMDENIASYFYLFDTETKLWYNYDRTNRKLTPLAEILQKGD